MLAIAAGFFLISLPHLGDRDFWAPDADRIGMDGIFLMDFLKDLPGSAMNAYQYTTSYYAKYPALSIGYRPPFFPLIESLFYRVLGLSHFSGKIAVLFSLFLGMVFWFKLVEQTHGSRIALISLLLWVTNPMVYAYSQQTMLEIPTLAMVIATTYFLWSYVRRPSQRLAVALAVVGGLTLWTNQKSAFILPMILISWARCWRRGDLHWREGWPAVVVLAAILIPFVAMTLWLGEQNLEQSMGSELGLQRFTWSDFGENVEFLYTHHFTPVLLGLILLGIVHALLNPKPGHTLFFVGILSVYLVFTFIRLKLPRYSMYWIPFFSLFAALGMKSIVDYAKGMLGASGAVRFALYSFPLLFQMVYLMNAFVPYASAYEGAAKYVIDQASSPVFFFDGYANGQFIFFMRVHDKKRDFVVVRGDKIISSSSILAQHKLQVHLHDKGQMLRELTDLGVQFVVVESPNIGGVREHAVFRELLEDSAIFKLHRTLRIGSNVPFLDGQCLLIYEYSNWRKPEKDKLLRLRLPVVGQTVEIPIHQAIHAE